MKATSWVRARRCRYWWRRGDGEPAAEFDKNVDSRKGGGCYVQCGARAGQIIIIAVQSAVIVHGVFFFTLECWRGERMYGGRCGFHIDVVYCSSDNKKVKRVGGPLPRSQGLQLRCS